MKFDSGESAAQSTHGMNGARAPTLNPMSGTVWANSRPSRRCSGHSEAKRWRKASGAPPLTRSRRVKTRILKGQDTNSFTTNKTSTWQFCRQPQALSLRRPCRVTSRAGPSPAAARPSPAARRLSAAAMAPDARLAILPPHRFPNHERKLYVYRYKND